MIISRSATFAARAPRMAAAFQRMDDRFHQRLDQRRATLRRFFRRRPTSAATLSVPGTVAPISVATTAPVSAATVPAPVQVAVPAGPVPQYLTGLGFSLKPPAWLRNFGGAVIKGTTITIQTPTGIPIVVDGIDPQAYQRVLAMLRGPRVSTAAGAAGPSRRPGAAQAIENIPGGWLTVATLGIAAFLLLKGRR